MSVTLGIVMDPIASIKVAKDTSLALLLAAQKRGWHLRYMEQSDLYLEQGIARAKARPLSVADSPDNWYQLGQEEDLALGDLDVILMRKDPPFDSEYIYSTYLLEAAQNQGALVVNNPQSLRDCNEKIFRHPVSPVLPAGPGEPQHRATAPVPPHPGGRDLQTPGRHGW